MIMISREFQLHIDAPLLNLRFKEAMYATVKYDTWFEGNKVFCLVFDIALGPSLLLELNNRPELVRRAEAAAMNDAKVYWSNQLAKEKSLAEIEKNKANNGQLHPAFEQALAPFIKH